jgi:hypothetical protein
VERDWRYEADDQWLVGRRSAFFRRRRSRFFQAFSDAELGPLGGPRRNPTLKLSDKTYSHVRYAPREFAHTAIQIELFWCDRCGHRLLEEHRLIAYRENGDHRTIGLVRLCRRCEKEAWLFISHMPKAEAGRARDAKAVL